MITKRALADFRARPRRDFRKCELWTAEQAERYALGMFSSLPPLWDKMVRSQKITFALAAAYGRLGIFSDMGAGKTLVVLALAKMLGGPWLIGVPNRINKAEWLREARKWLPDDKIEALPSEIAGKIAALEDGSALVYVDTFGGITRMLTVAIPRKAKKNSSKKKLKEHEDDDEGKRLVTDNKVIDALARSLVGVAADESSFFGNHDSLQTQIFERFAKRPELHLYLLSGTPFGKDPLPLQPQLRMLDRGHTLGETLGLFREVFYSKKAGYWELWNYTFLKKLQPLMNRYMAHCTVRFTLDKSDMPRVHRKITRITLPLEASEYYNRARDALKHAAILRDFKLTEGMFMAMRQISSGFLSVSLENGRERSVIDFKDNPKLDYLTDAVQTVGGAKFIVFHFFQHSAKLIGDRMRKLKISHTMINGSTKNVEKNLLAFAENDTQCLILSADAGAFGPNLQAGKYGFVFESPVSVIQRKQLLRRFIRPHSEHDYVFLNDLVVKNTVDERILEFYKSGQDLFKAILSRKVEL